jgi:hypothetical protein
LLAGVLSGLVTSLPALAADLRVPADYPTLWQAVVAAADDDTITVAPGVWTERENGSPGLGLAELRGGVFLRSEAGAALTILDGLEMPGPMIRIDTVYGARCRIEGFTLRGAGSGGCISSTWAEEFVVDECVLEENTAAYSLVRTSMNPFRIVDTTIRRNVCVRDLLFPMGLGPLTLERCDVSENVAIHLVYVYEAEDRGAMLHVLDCVFRDNLTASSAIRTHLGGGGSFLRNRFLRNRSRVYYEPVIHLTNRTLFTEFRENVFVENGEGGTGGIRLVDTNARLVRNLFYDEHVDAVALLRFEGDLYLAQFNQNILVGIENATLIHSEAHHVYQNECNLFWDNPGSGFGDWTPGTYDLLADPAFCDPEGEDFTVRGDSPCLPDNNPCGRLIGPYGQGCGPVRVEEFSWGGIKAPYRVPEALR